MSKNPSQVSLATATGWAVAAWSPVAPHVPAIANCSYQRYFSRVNDSNCFFELTSGKNRPGTIECVFREASVEVYRNGKKDCAELTLKVRIDDNVCEATVTADADELRQIACRLLDAAHDLDAFPASRLMVATA